MRRAAIQQSDAHALSGYGHASYASSLAEFGTPRRLPRSGAWVLERRIPGTRASDAMGCYPLFVCEDWQALEADLREIDGLVSLSLVSDPFGNHGDSDRRRCFGDVVIPFKPHFVTDLRQPIDRIVSRHHRYYARRALERVSIDRCDRPEEHLDDWVQLYDHLIARHQLKGIHAFSRASFAAQLRIPGAVMLRASCDGVVVGAHLWYLHGDVAQSHLTAVNARGYELATSYALHWSALQTFAGEVSWLNLGSGSGLTSSTGGGLAWFKQGWATGTRWAYFCGRIFDRGTYSELAASHPGQTSGYFPAYRLGEFS